MPDREKYVDESWKDSVEQEKEGLVGRSEDDLRPQPETRVDENGPQIPIDSSSSSEDSSQEEAVNFSNYVTSLVLQAMIFLGEIPNPLDDNKIGVNLKQAKFLIDTLLLIREKTKGNLSQEEDQLMNAALYELQLKFVEQSNKHNLSGEQYD